MTTRPPYRRILCTPVLAMILTCASGCKNLLPASLSKGPKTKPALAAVDERETVLEKLRATVEELVVLRKKAEDVEDALGKERKDREEFSKKLDQAERRLAKLKDTESKLQTALRKLEIAQTSLLKQQEQAQTLREELLGANITNTRLKQTIVKLNIDRARRQQLELKKRYTNARN